MDENRIMVNKQIQQLAEQAGLYFYLPNGNAYPCAMSAEECEIAYRKFAELIVRECLSYAEVSDGDLDFMVFMIKKHFGV